MAVERQREDCLALCKTKGWDPIEYVDNSISASSTKKRPQYQKMLADIEAGNIDAVVAYRLDRLHRQPSELETFISLADRKNTALATVTGEVDLSTDTGRLIARIMGAVAKQEMEAKSIRQKRAHTQRAAMGKPWAQRRPFGFLKGGEAHHEAEADVVRSIYSDILRGVGQTSICDRLNQEGNLTTLGNPWRQSSLRQLILNPRNAGLRAHNGEIVGPGTWEPIVPEDTWRAVCGIVLSHPLVGQRGSQHLLSGLTRCGLCGSSMTTGYTSRKVRMYRCQECNRVGRNADRVDAYISAIVLGRLSQPDAQQLLVDHHAPDTVALQETARALRLRLDQLAATYGIGQISMRDWQIARGVIEANLEATEAQITVSTSGAILAPLVNAPDPKEVWADAPMDHRRAVIRTLLNIAVNPTRRGGRFNPADIDVQWKQVV